MKYYKISEEDLLRLLRDSMTLKEIQSVKSVSADLAELDLSQSTEVPEYRVPMPEKPFYFVETESGCWKKVGNVSKD